MASIKDLEQQAVGRDKARANGAILALVRSRAPGSLAALERISTHSTYTRLCILDDLRRHPRSSPGADALIVSLMADRRWSVRDAAIDAATGGSRRRLIPSIVERLGDRNDIVRWDAIRALVDFEARRELRHIQPLLDDPDDAVRGTAVWAVGALGRPSDLVLLERRFALLTPRLRYETLGARYRLGDRDALRRLSRETVKDDMHCGVVSNILDDLFLRGPLPRLHEDFRPLLPFIEELAKRFPLSVDVRSLHERWRSSRAARVRDRSPYGRKPTPGGAT